MMTTTDISVRLGAVLFGGLIALGLTGIVSMQAFLYFRTFPGDYKRVRLTVALVWFFDLLHAALVCATNWRFLIMNWGNDGVLDIIPMPLSLTIVVTAVVTFIVHCFFTHRVLILSKRNWLLCGPMFMLAVLRLGAASATTGLMIHIGSFSGFLASYRAIFTLGLATSAVLDVLVAVGMCYYLRNSRTGFSSMDYVIDTIMLYTINNGTLTCVATIVSLICWLTVPQNLLFIGFHFAIAKLYANSFLATLNTRDSLRERSQGSSNDRGYPMPVVFPGRLHTNRFSGSGTKGGQNDDAMEGRSTKLQINVAMEKTIQVDGDPEIMADIMVR
ncbi:hypothetical protein JAAARDRAFT_28988 [Jaapia argillacea MUCL 33604]|uniref:DUF6534 domain-containing protein n=1 Tax=Jaapia argillacea MUCL 33604 TaxID=933084 RepID=A0A067Q7R7_9AGAM|nr:hypothetical protein JAAARDRAFT_28988 [Jaapia argillacea MUCL 33604]